MEIRSFDFIALSPENPVSSDGCRAQSCYDGTPMWLNRAGLVLAFAALVWRGFFFVGKTDFGLDRWPVKTFRDRDRSSVRMTPVDTTIAALARAPRPPRAAFRGRFRIAPEERTVYRIRGILKRIRLENDGDMHMVIGDPGHPSRTLIAEIPSPVFSIGSGLEDRFRRERAELRRHKPAGELVEVTGIGFFDYRPHTASGGAGNGFELHPVIDLLFLKGR